MADVLLVPPSMADPASARPSPDARRTRMAEWLLIAAFAGFLAVLVARHEPWFDEAQAWLLARDVPLPALLWKELRYEGTPGLWHLLLLAPARLGAPYATLGAIGGTAAVLGAVLLVRYGPFPLVFKAALLCSFFLGYQYAVIARSYTLLPPLLFGLAIVWPRRAERPWLLGLLLGLLALTSVHGAVVAGALTAVHLLGWRRLDRRHAIVVSGLAALGAVIVAVLWPPADLFNGGPWMLDPGEIARIVVRHGNAALTDVAPLSAAAVVLSAVWFARRRVLTLWLLPTLALLVLSAVKISRPWHEGLPFLVWVFSLWVSLDGAPRAGLDRWLRRGALAALAAVLAVQVVWWSGSVRYDLTSAYSGGEQLGAYLGELDPDAGVYLDGFHAMAALPYIDRNPFANYRGGQLPAHWSWTVQPPLVLEPTDLAEGVPDVFVYGYKLPGSLPPPDLPAYRLAAVFDGGLVFKGRVIEPDGFLVYELREDGR